MRTTFFQSKTPFTSTRPTHQMPSPSIRFSSINVHMLDPEVKHLYPDSFVKQRGEHKLQTSATFLFREPESPKVVAHFLTDGVPTRLIDLGSSDNSGLLSYQIAAQLNGIPCHDPQKLECVAVESNPALHKFAKQTKSLVCPDFEKEIQEAWKTPLQGHWDKFFDLL